MKNPAGKFPAQAPPVTGKPGAGERGRLAIAGTGTGTGTCMYRRFWGGAVLELAERHQNRKAWPLASSLKPGGWQGLWDGA